MPSVSVEGSSFREKPQTHASSSSVRVFALSVCAGVSVGSPKDNVGLGD